MWVMVRVRHLRELLRSTVVACLKSHHKFDNDLYRLYPRHIKFSAEYSQPRSENSGKFRQESKKKIIQRYSVSRACSKHQQCVSVETYCNFIMPRCFWHYESFHTLRQLLKLIGQNRSKNAYRTTSNFLGISGRHKQLSDQQRKCFCFYDCVIPPQAWIGWRWDDWDVKSLSFNKLLVFDYWSTRRVSSARWIVFLPKVSKS